MTSRPFSLPSPRSSSKKSICPLVAAKIASAALSNSSATTCSARSTRQNNRLRSLSSSMTPARTTWAGAVFTPRFFAVADFAVRCSGRGCVILEGRWWPACGGQRSSSLLHRKIISFHAGQIKQDCCICSILGVCATRGLCRVLMDDPRKRETSHAIWGGMTG